MELEKASIPPSFHAYFIVKLIFGLALDLAVSIFLFLHPFFKSSNINYLFAIILLVITEHTSGNLPIGKICSGEIYSICILF